MNEVKLLFEQNIAKVSENDPELVEFGFLLDKKNPTNQIKLVIEAMKYNTNVKHLIMCTLYISKFEVETAILLADFIKSNKTITKLSLPYCKLTEENAKYLANAFLENDTIETLIMYYCELDAHVLQYFTDALKFNKSIKMIDWSDNKLGDVGMDHICELLKVNTNINEFKLQKIGIKSVKNLAEALKINHTLKILDLSNNGGVGFIDSNEYSCLFETLKYNKGLEKLKIQFGVTNESMLILADTLIVNRTLKEIKIDSDLDQPTIDYLIEAININESLHELKICCKTLPLQDYFANKVKKSITLDFYDPTCYARLC